MIMTRKCTLPVCILELIFLRPGHFKKCFLFPGCHNTVLHDLCQVFCCCRMYAAFIFRIQSVWRNKMGVLTTDLCSFCIHFFCKFFYTSGNALCHSHSAVIMRFQHQGIQQVFDVEHFPFLHPKMYLRLGRSLIRYFYRLIRMFPQVFQRKDTRHNLRCTCHRTDHICILSIQYPAAVCIHQHCRSGIKFCRFIPEHPLRILCSIIVLRSIRLLLCLFFPRFGQNLSGSLRILCPPFIP